MSLYLAAYFWSFEEMNHAEVKMVSLEAFGFCSSADFASQGSKEGGEFACSKWNLYWTPWGLALGKMIGYTCSILTIPLISKKKKNDPMLLHNWRQRMLRSIPRVVTRNTKWREDPAIFHVNGICPNRELWGTARQAWEEILLVPVVSVALFFWYGVSLI